MSFIKRFKAACWNERFDLTRVALHFPVGVIIVSSYIISPVIPPVLAVMFLLYQLNEGRHLRDRAFLDIAGANAGAWATVIGLLACRWL